MPVSSLSAIPHPAGNRIDLEWRHPYVAVFPDLRVVRREHSHPLDPNPAVPALGVIVADTQPLLNQLLVQHDDSGIYRTTDAGLRAETMYYYMVYPYSAGPVFEVDLQNRAAAMATAANGFADWMYKQLPGIYHRYDLSVPRGDTSEMATVDLERGQLRRFLDLPGGELDRLYSFTRALLNAHSLDLVDPVLLPLLANWIGWKSDTRLEVNRQRSEIRDATAIYQRVGVLPVVASTVKRISGWESQTKEFVDNIFASNRPERLNLWTSLRSGNDAWVSADIPFSLDFSYHGRAASTVGPEGTRWLFQSSAKHGQPQLRVKRIDADGWTPSERLLISQRVDQHPAAATLENAIWLFFEGYEPVTRQWRMYVMQRIAGVWSEADVFEGESAPERRRPSVATDDAGGLWLFYQERSGAGWEVRYNRFDGAVWQVAGGSLLPLDVGNQPRVESDPVVVIRPNAANRRLWFFWTRKTQLASDPLQSRWTIAYRVKNGLDPSDETDWQPIQTLTKDAEDIDDREPAVLLDGDGNLELFWSSTADGGWSVRRATLAAATGTPGAPETITGPPFSQRAPIPLMIDAGVLLVFGSNRSLEYHSDVYRAMRTMDRRYSGATTLAIRNTAKFALRNSFDDFQTYTYDAGAGGVHTVSDWFSRDTIGLYITPDTIDEDAIAAGSTRLRDVIGEFIPATDRAILIRSPVDT